MATQRKFNFGKKLTIDGTKQNVNTLINNRVEKLQNDGFSGREQTNDNNTSDLIRASEFNYLFKLIESDIDTAISKGDSNYESITTLNSNHQELNSNFENHKTVYEQKVNSLYELLSSRSGENYFALDKIKLTNYFLQDGKANNLVAKQFLVKEHDGNASINFQKGNGSTGSLFSSSTDSQSGKIGLWVSQHGDIFNYELSNNTFEVHKNIKLSSNAILNADNNKIINLGNPNDVGDAANKSYVDSKIQEAKNYADNKIIVVPTPTNGTNATNKSYVDTKIQEAKSYTDNKLLNVENPTQNKHVANKEYVDDKVLKSKISIFDKGVFKKLYISEVQEHYLEDDTHFDNKTLHFNVGKKLGFAENTSGVSDFIMIPTWRFQLEVLQNNKGWAIKSSTDNGRAVENNTPDIKFDNTGLSNSKLKNYIDNAVRNSQQSTLPDYKIRTTKLSKSISSTGIWKENFYNFKDHKNANITADAKYNIIGMTFVITFSNKTTRSISISSLPAYHEKLNFQVIANDDGGTPWVQYFTLEQYSTNISWHDFNLSWEGRHSVYNGAWATSSFVKNVDVILSYQQFS